MEGGRIPFISSSSLLQVPIKERGKNPRRSFKDRSDLEASLIFKYERLGYDDHSLKDLVQDEMKFKTFLEKKAAGLHGIERQTTILNFLSGCTELLRHWHSTVVTDFRDVKC